MDYNIISGDSHVDMSWLPGDLFLKNNTQRHLQDLMPRVIESEEGIIWVAEKDNVLGVAQSAGFEFIAPIRGRRRRTNLMLDAGFYDGPARPVDPNLRFLDVMTTDGVDCEILYGITGSGKNLKLMDVVTEVYHIYNDWVNHFCATYPGRWYALACLPIHDPGLAAQEVWRMAEGHEYVRGADLMAGALTYPIYSRDGYWDSLWQACADTGTPISFHIGGGIISIPATPNLDQTINFTEPGQNEEAYDAVRGTVIQLSNVQILAHVIFSGACERYPNLKFVLGESGAGWIPFALDRMDHVYHEHMCKDKFDPPMPMLPSEYWFRQGHTTFQEEVTAGQMAHLIGVNNMMWGSDYPHPDTVWPDSKTVIAQTLGDLGAEDRKKIVCDNAMNLYNVGSIK